LRKYTVTMEEDAFLRLLEANQMVVRVEDDGDVSDRAFHRFTEPAKAVAGNGEQSVRKPRKLRGSKVNDTILGALEGNAGATSAQLKEAMVSKGLAAGSLSTGLAMLQKAGRVVRDNNGTYRLAA